MSRIKKLKKSLKLVENGYEAFSTNKRGLLRSVLARAQKSPGNTPWASKVAFIRGILSFSEVFMKCTLWDGQGRAAVLAAVCSALLHGMQLRAQPCSAPHCPQPRVPGGMDRISHP